MARVIGRMLVLLVPLAVLLAVAAALPASRAVAGIQVGPVHRVTQTPYVFEPAIAVDPTNPDHLAAVAISPSTADCDPFQDPGSCTINLVLDTSEDGGASWREAQITPDGGGDPSVAFAPDGALYDAGLRGLFSPLVFVQRVGPAGVLSLADVQILSTAQPVDKPWLSVDGRGVMDVAYSGGTDLGHEGVLLARSATGSSWSDPVVVAQGPLVFDSQGRQVAFPPWGAQALFGPGGRLAVTWSLPTQFTPPRAWRRELRLAESSDDGQTFSAPRTLAEAWSAAAGVSRGGVAYLAYRAGQEQDQQLTVVRSSDGGRTWTTATASGSARLYLDDAPIPGIDVAPDGTVDLVYYASRGRCLDPAGPARATQAKEEWTNPCSFDVAYTYSKDGGRTWAPPATLNAAPIEGSGFVHIQGFSRPGEYIGMASTDRYAYPIWIDGTHAYTARIAR